MTHIAARSNVRLAELLAVLSLATDLGMGLPMEHVLRQCVLSLRLAERMGLPEEDRAAVYYAALLAWVGCHVDAYEQAKWFGDDLARKADFRRVDFRTPMSGPAFMLRHLGAGRPASERVRLGAAFATDGRIRAPREVAGSGWPWRPQRRSPVFVPCHRSSPPLVARAWGNRPIYGVTLH